MQCYEYFAIRQYARHCLGESTDGYDDLDLADRLDDLNVDSIRDVSRLSAADTGDESTSH